MNIFQLYFANTAKLTLKQQSAQKALHTFVITILSSAIGESYILISQKEPVSIIVGTALIGSAILATVGSAIVPFLQEQGVNQPTIDEIKIILSDMSATLKDVAASQQKDQAQ